MRQVIVRGFLGRKLRSVLTALAIILGVAMIVGSAVLTAQIRGAFDGIFLQARKGTDVVVTKKATFKNDQGQTTVPFDESVVDQVKAVARRAAGVGSVSSISARPDRVENGKPTDQADRRRARPRQLHLAAAVRPDHDHRGPAADGAERGRRSKGARPTRATSRSASRSRSPRRPASTP